VTISRAAGSVTFPSEFMLVAAMNPCPCGYFGDLKRECVVTTPLVATFPAGTSQLILRCREREDNWRRLNPKRA
jgi:predicted ATPase with chaperone activity